MDFSGSKITDLALISSLAEGPWLPLTSLELIKQHGRKVKHLRDRKAKASNSQVLLSTGCIMKLAKEWLLQIKSQKTGSAAAAQTELPFEVSEDLELALLLQAAAEKVACQQWVHAQKLLTLCSLSASQNGNPVQRVVYYFAEALRERIDRECGRFCLEECVKKAMDVRQAEIHLQPEMMECQQEVPIRVAAESAAIQVILDAVQSSKTIHLIDLGINNGSHWTQIMQHFVARCDCPVEILKITAVGTSKEMLEMTGNQLSSFAKSINLPFSFLIVLSELKDLKEGLFYLDGDEAVAIYSEFRLSTLLPWPNHLETLLGVIRNLKPGIMVIKEMEVSINNQNFLERFDEALLVFSSLFDSIKVCMEHRIMFRTWSEEVVYQQMIRNIVATEGSQRVFRHERIGTWRKLFAEFGMMETDFSSSCISQATILLRRSIESSSSTLNVDGKCLIFGWKGTSILSLSAWKFHPH